MADRSKIIFNLIGEEAVGAQFKDIINEHSKNLRKTTTELEKVFRKNIKASLMDWSLLVELLGEEAEKINQLNNSILLTDSAVFQNTTELQKIRENLEKIVGSKIMKSVQLDHTDVGPIDVYLTSLLFNLEALLQDLQEGKQLTATQKRTLRVRGTVRVNELERQITDRIKAIQKLRLLSTELGNSKDSDIQPNDLIAIAKNYAGGYYDIKYIKKKDVDVTSKDGVSASLTFESKEFNSKRKGKLQKQLGIAARRIMKGYDDSNRPVANALIKEFLKDLFTVEGSKAISQELLEQLELAANRRAGRKYKSKSTVKRRVNVKGIQKEIQKIQQTIRTKQRTASARLKNASKKRSISDQEGAAVLGSILSGRGGKKRSGKQRNLSVVKENINRKLPAQVRSNMGRPALENQSGTFSNSVRLERLIQGPKTIIGEYSYQYAPYETFENSDRWPSGYNPKPLITQSIRELALKTLGNKFTLRRA